VARARPTLKTSEAIDSHKFFARKAESNSREKGFNNPMSERDLDLQFRREVIEYAGSYGLIENWWNKASKMKRPGTWPGLIV